MEETRHIILELDQTAVWSFIGYLVLIIVIGLVSTKFSSSGISNYFIGGRKMNLFVVAMSSVVSGRSAWLLLGVTGMAFTMGLSAIWATIGYILVEFWLFFFYAPRIRRFSEHYECITLPDFFAARFDDRKGNLRMISAIIILVFMVAYVAAQFVAGGKTFATSFNISSEQGIYLTASIILFYTLFGGFLAVSLTDTIQGLFMLLALLALPVILIVHSGGIEAFITQVQTIEDGDFFSLSALSAGALIGFLAIGLGSPGSPHIIARYFSITHAKALKKVAIVGTLTNILMAVGAVLTGIGGRLFIQDLTMLPGADAENLFPVLASEHLNPVMFGIVISSIFAAIMSTADSQLLVAASAVVRDIYEKSILKGKEISQKQLMLISRFVLVLLVFFALLMGFYAGELVFWLVLFAWAGLGAAFGTTSILALYWKGASKTGVIAGMLSGSISVIIWNQISALKSMVYELIPGFLIAIIVTVVVSKYTAKPDDVDTMFNRMKED